MHVFNIEVEQPHRTALYEASNFQFEGSFLIIVLENTTVAIPSHLIIDVSIKKVGV